MFATEQDSAGGDPWECSDGRYVVFLLGLHGGKSSANVWRADAAGGNLKQLTQSKQDNYPVCAPDSRSVYYMDGATWNVMQVPIDGGAPRKFPTSPSTRDSSMFLRTADTLPSPPSITWAHEEKLVLIAPDTGQVQKW